MTDKKHHAITIDGKPLSEYLIQQQAAELLHISVRTLERMRLEGTGPRFLKAGRRVLYSRLAIEQWLETREFESAAEARAAGVR